MQDNDTLSPIQMFFRNKWVRLILCFNFLPIIIVIALIIYNNTNDAIIIFNVTPIDATITVNNNSNYNTTSTYKLQSGTYTINISHENLDSKTIELNLVSNSSTLLSTYLSANSGTDFSFYELKANYDSTQRLLSIASPDDNQTYDHDTSAEEFVTQYGATLNAFNSALPIIESSRESPDNGGRILSNISISQDNSCLKYLCATVSAFGFSDIHKTTQDLLENAGMNLKYLEIKYETD